MDVVHNPTLMLEKNSTADRNGELESVKHSDCH